MCYNFSPIIFLLKFGPLYTDTTIANTSELSENSTVHVLDKGEGDYFLIQEKQYDVRCL